MPQIAVIVFQLRVVAGMLKCFFDDGVGDRRGQLHKL